MKKITTMIATAALIISTSAFATTTTVTGEKLSQNVETAFLKKFTSAANVTWSQSGGYYFAHFEMDKNDLSVAYSEDGLLVATSRIITKEELPADLVNSLKDQFGNYTVCTTVTEIVLEGEKSYYLNVENKNSVLRLKCSPDGQLINVETSTKKKELVGKVF